jgi:predicted metal-dependent phosphoesterase TrpH
MELLTDLHLHSSASDGILSPKEVVRWAALNNLKIISLTDHDTVDGLNDAREECQRLGVAFVSGIELSAYSTDEIHILGYGIDYENDEFIERLSAVKAQRAQRNAELKDKLAQLGVHVDVDPMEKGAGRMNFARDMVKKGISRTPAHAFEQYLGKGGLAYTPSKRLKPFEAVELIRDFNGLPVLAHPKRFIQDKNLLDIIEGLIPHGLLGVEVYYPSHSAADIAELKRLAKSKNLIATGGSDYHGEELSAGFESKTRSCGTTTVKYIPDKNTLSALRLNI